MENTGFYSLTTKKKTLRCSHQEWLERTQIFYNEILTFYYMLYLDQEQLRGRNSQQCMRELERLTIVGREKQPVPYPLPWKKVPLYFRRAAINGAISAGKTSQSEGAGRAERFSKAVTYYKGMYRDFTEESIELKVWTGECWKYLRCRLYGRELPEEAERLSPSVVLRREGCQLHIPVKEAVRNGKNAKERMRQGASLCCIQFTNEDTLAVCASFGKKGALEESVFFRGGNQYAHICREIQSKIQRSRAACGSKNEGDANRKYWEKLKNVSDYFSNSISRQIIKKCLDWETEIIVLPKFERTYTRHVMNAVGKWSPLYLSCRIREQLKSKAWREGILVLEVNPLGSGRLCAQCSEPVRKEGQQFVCVNGHQGNRHLNAAKNLHKRCMEEFDRQVQGQ